MIRTVLLDLDGTIVNSEPGITACVQYTLKAYGLEELDAGTLRTFIGPPLRQSFMRHCGVSERQAEDMVKKYRERYVPVGMYESGVYPGVEHFLKFLRREGYQVALASSKPEEMCKKLLEHFKLSEYFDEIVGATPDGRIDTKLEVLRELFLRLHIVSPDEVALVGDTRFDAEGAKEAGIRAIGITYGFGTRQEMEDAGAVVFDSLPEVERYLINDRDGG